MARTEQREPGGSGDPSRTRANWLDIEQQRAWRSLLLGTTLLMDRLDDDLRAHQISLPEYEVLVRLSERDGAMRMAALADALAHSRSRVTHTIKRMERAGLVLRVETADDGRGVTATLTERGAATLRSLAPLHVAGVRENLIDLATPEDLAAVHRVMDAVADALIDRHPEMELR